MRKLYRAAGAFAIIALTIVVYVFYPTGLFLEIEPYFAGTCEAVEGVTGAEDLTIHPRTGIVYLSAYDRRSAFAGGESKGGIFAFDITVKSPKPIDLTTGFGPDFRPHGISLWRNPDNGLDRLFVINHAGGGNKIEIFEITGIGLRHVESIGGAALVTPNDIFAVGPRQFYATNDHRYASGWKRKMEDYFRLPESTVVYFDGEDFSVAVPDIGLPNGINGSDDGTRVYIAASSSRALHVFARDPDSGVLAHEMSIDIPGWPDNIEIGPGGDLLVGVHANVLALLAHVADPGVPSPSRIVRLAQTQDGGFSSEIIFDDPGERLSAAATGAAYGDALVIGPVFDAHFLICRATQPEAGKPDAS